MLDVIVFNIRKDDKGYIIIVLGIVSLCHNVKSRFTMKTNFKKSLPKQSTSNILYIYITLCRVKLYRLKYYYTS